jgi:MerR family copper efflux transcriptional regulator
MILQAKEAGLALEEIRAMMTAPDSRRRDEVLSTRRAALRATIAKAQAQLELIEGALDCDHDDIVACPHFQRVISLRTGESHREPERQLT